MRVFLWSLLGFCLGLGGGYAAIFFGWIWYADRFEVFDRDGGMIMQVAFVFAPAGALLVGIVLAVWLGLRAVREEDLV